MSSYPPRSGRDGGSAADVLVQKYGGSSLATPERVRRVAASVTGVYRSGHPMVVVVSARGDTTDELLQLAGQVNAGITAPGADREVDQLLATGECSSAALMALALHGKGVPAVSLTGGHAGILVHGRHTSGVVVAIAHDLDVARVLVHATGTSGDLAMDLFSVLASHSVPVDLLARSEPYEQEFRMGFTIRRGDADKGLPPLRRTVAALGGGVRVDHDVGKVSLVGMGLLNRPEYTARMPSTLAAAGIPTDWVSTSQLRSSVTVPLDQIITALGALHGEFELERDDAGVGSTTPA